MLIRRFFLCLVLASELSVSQATPQDPGFVCVTLDWWPSTKCDYSWCPWHNSSVWAIDLDEIKPYARLLAPFLLRVGGSLQDKYIFKPDCSSYPQFPLDPNGWFGFGNGCISEQRVKEISDFCLDVGCQLVWGLNGMAGRTKDGQGSWDSRNAHQLLDFFANIKAPLHAVTLGNEVWGEMVNLSLDQACAAFADLDAIVSKLWNDDKRPLIGGLDGYVNRRQLSFLSNFTKRISQDNIRVDVLNYHEYPLGTSNDGTVVDRALSHDVGFRLLALQVAGIALPTQEVWMSECGGSENSGSLQATASFASGFWYLDDMAMLHHAGYRRFCRQTLAGGNYGLLDQVSPRKPHPDFWNAVLYQRILGKPLTDRTHQLRDLVQCEGETSMGSATRGVQWYAYEARGLVGFTAYLGISTHATLRCGLIVSKLPTNITEFVLTPGDHEADPWNAVETKLNGERLVDAQAQLDGRSVVSRAAWLEPLTYGFFVVEDHREKPVTSLLAKSK